MDEVQQRRGPEPAGFVIAGILLAVAGVIAWDASSITRTSVYGLGPEAVPYAVATGLAMLAVANAVLAYRGDMPDRPASDTKPIVLILGGMAALIALVRLGGGFIPATAVLFAMTSAAFGRRAFLTDLLIGLVIGILIFLVFVKLLTLSLPAGPIERLF